MKIQNLEKWESENYKETIQAERKDLFKIQQQAKNCHLVNYDELYTLLITPQKIGLDQKSGLYRAKAYLIDYKHKLESAKR